MVHAGTPLPPSETWDIVSKVGKACKRNLGSLMECIKNMKSCKKGDFLKVNLVNILGMAATWLVCL